MSTDCSWDLDPVLAEYTNKYIDNFVPTLALINESIYFNPMPENLKRSKILHPHL